MKNKYISEVVKELSLREISEKLYEEKILGFPIWNILRFNFRINHLKKIENFSNKTKINRPNYFQLLTHYSKSFGAIISIIFRRDQKEKVVFWALPRLVKFGNIYIDKYTDPVINKLNDPNQALIFQRNLSGVHLTPRYNAEKVIYTDFIDVNAKVVSIIISPIILIIYFRKILKILRKIKKIYSASNNTIYSNILALSNFLINYISYKFLFKTIKVKKMVIVSRPVFLPQILLARKKGIGIFELQHGITRTETALYTGKYIEYADPDFFLAFGKVWINPYFGVPESKIINIGWAYRDFAEEKLSNIKGNDKYTILVISSPGITDEIIDFMIKACDSTSNIKFNLRLHPQEELNSKQEGLIGEEKKICVSDNSVDSLYAIASHQKIIGEKSTVLYEALSMGKSVGRINMMGLDSTDIDKDKKLGFFIISSIKDFVVFTEISEEQKEKNEDIFTSFDKELFNDLIA